MNACKHTHTNPKVEHTQDKRQNLFFFFFTKDYYISILVVSIYMWSIM